MSQARVKKKPRKQMLFARCLSAWNSPRYMYTREPGAPILKIAEKWRRMKGRGRDRNNVVCSLAFLALALTGIRLQL